MMIKQLLSIILFATSLSSCAQTDRAENQDSSQKKLYAVVKTEAEWKAELSADEYYIIREKGTERPFTGDLLNNKSEGTYTCRACDHPLFESDTKFESGTGWPSFFEAIKGNVEEDEDNTLGMKRVEILCQQCGGHLGHVFNDGPNPTGLRYCVNSASLDFVEKR